MTNANQARYLHRMLDRLIEGERVEPQEVEVLRKSLPELPSQKTLEEIAWDMHFAWSETYGNDWEEELFGDLETWLSNMHSQLKGLKSTHPEFLETEADYENAPEGTIVTMDGVGSAWVKEQYGWPGIRDSIASSAYTMAGLRRRVLRWGWGNE